jgi:hypothetical protein
MINLLKQAAVYTGVYFVIFNIIFWTMFFAMIALQCFWKLFVAVFILSLALLSFDHFKVGQQLKDIFSKWKVPTLATS